MPQLSYFPQLSESKLFLASPGDVVPLRQMAQQVVNDLVGSSGGGADSLAIFAWETDLADTMFNDSVPIQEQIYRPDDRLCRGLVAFFGEKIGQPLAADFPEDMLREVLEAARPGPERLVHPWHPEEADNGGFPLTGSTFEVLCAIAANKHNKRMGTQLLPVFVRFVGPPGCVEEEDVGRANWGNRALRRTIRSKFEQDELRERQELDVVREQLKTLRNFARFLIRLGLEVTFETDVAAIETQLKDFLREHSIVTLDPTGLNPFLGLGSYDVDHYRIYFGRNEAQRKAKAEVEALFKSSDKQNFYWIEGSSGSGKSSFLRAGIIGALKHASMSGAEYAHVVHRPNNLLSRAAATAKATHCPLRVMFEHALAAVMGLEADDGPGLSEVEAALEAFDSCSIEERAAWVTQTLGSMLGRINSSRDPSRQCRLVLGIDQFEEIVDMTEDEELGPRWSLFIDFLTQVPKSDHVLVLATIREERIAKMRSTPALESLRSETQMQSMLLQFPTDAELETIITKPFDDYGRAELDEELVGHLIKVIRSYADVHVGKDQGSVLPLVSLALLRIHEQIAVPLVEKRFEDRDQEPSLDEFDEVASDPSPDRLSNGKVVIGLAEAEAHTRIEGVIEELARRAMEAALTLDAMKAAETTVDALLRQLVRWSGADDKQFSLPTVAIPADSSEAALARELIKNRLLVDEGSQTIRLVHETVLKHWPEAFDFIQREKPLHESARLLTAYAEDWAQSDNDRALLVAGLRRHATAAFSILALWVGRMHSYFCKAIDPRDVILRDYCLALLDATCDPLQVVEASPKDTTHAHLATLYDRRETIQKMLRAADDPAEVLKVCNTDKRTPLFAPCFLHDVDFVEMLLKAGADPNAIDKDGWQPLHSPGVGGSVEIARCLVAHGAVVDLAASPEEIHPLHLAAQNGQLQLATYCVKELGVDVDIKDAKGQTPLMHATIKDQADAVAHLFDLGADLSVCQDSGLTGIGLDALNYAARNGAVRSIEVLLDLGMSADAPMKNGWFPLHLAAHNNYPASVRVLASHMKDVDIHTFREFNLKTNETIRKKIASGGTHADAGWTATHLAALQGHIKVIRALADKGANLAAVTSQGETPLHIAVRKGRAQAAIVLAQRREVFGLRDEKGRTPMQLAFEINQLPLAEDLARQGAGFTDPVRGPGLRAEGDVTLLHLAAVSPDEGKIKLILSHERNFGHRTARGRNVLHLAAGAGRDRTLARLLKLWTDGLFERDDEGATPFDAACLVGAADCAELIEQRSDPDTLRKECPAALHYSAAAGGARLVQKLIDWGFDVHSTDAEGRTALHIAAQDGKANVVKELLQNGAKPQRPLSDDPDVSAFELATECGQAEVLEILLSRKAAAAIDLETLAFQALDLLHLDCVVAILKHLDKTELAHPETGVPISVLYAAKIAAALPGTVEENEELDEILNSAPTLVASPPASLPVPIPQPLSDMPSGELKTQSRIVGLAGDLYPEFEREPRTLWSALEPGDLAGLVERLSPIDGKYHLNPETLRGSHRELPWYKGVSLVNLRDSSQENPRLRFFFLAMGGTFFRLNGTSPPIHDVNAKAPIELKPEHLADYLRFFCFFVRGEEGPFYICEDAGDPLIPGNNDEKVRNVIKATVRPISHEGSNSDGDVLLSGVIFYSNAIFIANFAVKSTGMIEMLDDEPIAADLPFKLDAPLS